MFRTNSSLKNEKFKAWCQIFLWSDVLDHFKPSAVVFLPMGTFIASSMWWPHCIHWVNSSVWLSEIQNAVHSLQLFQWPLGPVSTSSKQKANIHFAEWTAEDGALCGGKNAALFFLHHIPSTPEAEPFVTYRLGFCDVAEPVDVSDVSQLYAVTIAHVAKSYQSIKHHLMLLFILCNAFVCCALCTLLWSLLWSLLSSVWVDLVAY